MLLALQTCFSLRVVPVLAHTLILNRGKSFLALLAVGGVGADETLEAAVSALSAVNLILPTWTGACSTANHKALFAT